MSNICSKVFFSLPTLAGKSGGNRAEPYGGGQSAPPVTIDGSGGCSYRLIACLAWCDMALG